MAINPSERQAIRILIVDDIPETRENLKKLLYFEQDIQVVGVASNGEEGIERVKEIQPDVVLMDINMPGMDGVTAGEQIAEISPATQVIMMSVQGEADYLRRSMLAGAREFLIKPFTAEELVTSIRRVYELEQRRHPAAAAAPPPVQTPHVAPPVAVPPPGKEGKIVAIYGTKGGVGTSTIVVNLAIATQEMTNARVVIVDGNLQFGDIGVLLNLSSGRSIADAAEQMEDLDEDFLSSLLIGHSSGIKVLLAPPRPEMAELVTTEQIVVLLKHLQNMFDYIFVDTWASFQEPTLTLLDMSDRIILLTSTEIPAIKNTKIIFEVMDALNYDPGKILLVLNKYDPRSGIRVRDIEASVKHATLAEIIRDDTIATQAVNQGLPIVESQRKTAIGQGLFKLARRLLEQLPPPGESKREVEDKLSAKSSGGLFHRWRRNK